MKQFKCPFCNKALNKTVVRCNNSDHYFGLNYNHHTNKPIGFYIVDRSENINQINFLLEIVWINNKLHYYFKNKNMSKASTIFLDEFILNDFYEKILNDKLSKEYVLNTINKLQDLMLFL